jgi:hypothetical protein
MITKTLFSTSIELVQNALYMLPKGLLDQTEERITINKPTGDFFYSPWEIKEEFKGTVWEEIYNSLTVSDKGEARIIRLNSGESYISHADMDDRYHLNLSGINCFLIDLDNKIFHELNADGIWYDMDAGRIHTAANFGNRIRFQVVVRKLLSPIVIDNAVHVTIQAKEDIDKDDARYILDSQVSPWLNQANKHRKIANFKVDGTSVSFNINRDYLLELVIIPTDFNIITA